MTPKTTDPIAAALADREQLEELSSADVLELVFESRRRVSASTERLEELKRRPPAGSSDDDVRALARELDEARLLLARDHANERELQAALKRAQKRETREAAVAMARNGFAQLDACLDQLRRARAAEEQATVQLCSTVDTVISAVRTIDSSGAWHEVQGLDVAAIEQRCHQAYRDLNLPRQEGRLLPRPPGPQEGDRRIRHAVRDPGSPYHEVYRGGQWEQSGAVVRQRGVIDRGLREPGRVYGAGDPAEHVGDGPDPMAHTRGI